MTRIAVVVLTLAALTIGFGTSAVMAQGAEKPVQLSLFSPVQLMPEQTPIKGVRLTLLYSRNTKVTGLDWGFLITHNTSGLSKGLQMSLVGMNDADFVGFQASAVNITKKNFEGFQWGVVNYAGHANGFQLGFVNYAVTLKGLQIGLVNIIKQGGQFPVFPIINWSF